MFLSLLTKILPLYIIIALGFITGRVWKITPRDLAKIAIFVLAPLFFFGRVSQTPLHLSQGLTILLVVTLFPAAGFIALFIAQRVFKSSKANLAAYLVVGANTGYFGTPLFIALRGDQEIGAYTLVNICFIMLEATVSYYIIARGNFSSRESLIKLLKLPAIYAVLLGVIVSLNGWSLPEWSLPLWQNVQGAYVVLGMMILGLSLAQVPRFEIDWALFAFPVVGKIALFCVVMLIVIGDRQWNVLGPLNRDILTVVSLVPLAGNAPAYAAEVGVHPEKAATLVFASTLLALIYIPLAYSFMR